jgi:hypothetical protein
VIIGSGPSLRVADLPSPPTGWLEIARIVGPSVIVLGMGIGAGEWLLAPAAAVKYGTSILWIATIAIIIQTLAFIEAVRYTMYTGEPLTTGIMRLKPGPLFWGPLLLALLVLSLGWPVWAFGAATAVVSAYLGRLSGADDVNLVVVAGLLLAMTVLAILAFGGVVVKVLELAEWIMMFFVLATLIVLVALVVPGSKLIDVVGGFASFGSLPSVDILSAAVLLGALAGYAGAGSFANTVLSSYYRDKGFAMGRYSGAITTIVGGASITLASSGAVFQVSEESLRRWRGWMRIAILDIVGIFTLGSFLGILLPVSLAVTLIPQGSDISGWAAAAYQAGELRKLMGFAGWALVLILGFWILYSTQMGLMELVARTATDILWTMSPKLRELARGDVRLAYYPILAFMAFWVALSFILFYKFKVNPVLASALVANMSNIVYPLTVLANIYLNNKYLPKEIRPSPLITVALLLGCLFWLTFFVLFLRSLIG